MSGCQDETVEKDSSAAVDSDAGAGDFAEPVEIVETGETGETADAGPDQEAQRQLILAVPETESWSMPGLTAPVHVVRVEASIPHIYASTPEDLGRVLGFVTARDRYMIMDLQRRLGDGTLSPLLGEMALASDMESRQQGFH